MYLLWELNTFHYFSCGAGQLGCCNLEINGLFLLLVVVVCLSVCVPLVDYEFGLFLCTVTLGTSLLDAGYPRWKNCLQVDP